MASVDSVHVLSKTALFAGVLGLGVALGASLGLEATQSVCVLSSGTGATGQLALDSASKSAATICWENARTLQTVANASGYTAAFLLLGGGLVDRFDERVRSLLADFKGGSA